MGRPRADAELAVRADAPVWKIVKGDHHLFIGGTIHILTPADYPLPAAFEEAYGEASRIVFEADIQEMQTAEFQQSMLSRTTYPEGRDLTMFLDDATREDLAEFLSARGIPMENILRFKPGMVSITLTLIELQRLGLSGTGVDEFFSLKALEDQKAIGGLETADEQLSFLVSMGEGQEDELIAYTLSQIEELPTLMQAMKDAWRAGDRQKLEEVALKPLKNDFPKVYEQFVVERNDAWMPRIEAMLETQAVEFVLVGALHLVGDEGLLTQLEERGYAVKRPFGGTR